MHFSVTNVCTEVALSGIVRSRLFYDFSNATVATTAGTRIDDEQGLRLTDSLFHDLGADSNGVVISGPALNRENAVRLGWFSGSRSIRRSLNTSCPHS